MRLITTCEANHSQHCKLLIGRTDPILLYSLNKVMPIEKYCTVHCYHLCIVHSTRNSHGIDYSDDYRT